MKVIIPERQRILNPKARPTIRAMLQRCAAQTLIEVFEFGGSGTRIRAVEDEVNRLLNMYDGRYTDSKEEFKALLKYANEHGIDYPVRPGSGEKVLVGIEHDLMFLAYLVALHVLEHFGDKRLERFQKELCRRIRYYNYVFDGTPDVVLDVMDDRLARYGKTASEQFAPVKRDLY